MIDIHNHILPNVDDGAPHLQESLLMARQAEEKGVTTIVATPHHRLRDYFNTREDILEKVDKLNVALEAENIAVKILPGQETRLYGEMVHGIHNGELLTTNDQGKYLFVELPSDEIPHYASQTMYDLLQSGVTPIIVHPERNKAIRNKPHWLYDMVKMGTMTQLTASSITGHFGKEVKQFSHLLITHNLTQFVASDAHGVKRRNNRLADAYRLITKIYGEETTEIFKENSQLVIEGYHLIVHEPEKVKKKKFLGIF
ncbi:tyrosine protein phosphatase [Bacillaceae bacterium JMAK1]|nr:tyrosine protein phosphatase [Bacillaceae bacterium JMAK1]